MVMDTNTCHQRREQNTVLVREVVKAWGPGRAGDGHGRPVGIVADGRASWEELAAGTRIAARSGLFVAGPLDGVDQQPLVAWGVHFDDAGNSRDRDHPAACTAI